MRVDALDDLTVELQYETQYAVSRRMLGPEIEGEVAQGGFGHNGLASAAGSTLAADAGSRSIGFQFHRADVIPPSRASPRPRRRRDSHARLLREAGKRTLRGRRFVCHKATSMVPFRSASRGSFRSFGHSFPASSYSIYPMSEPPVG